MRDRKLINVSKAELETCDKTYVCGREIYSRKAMPDSLNLSTRVAQAESRVGWVLAVKPDLKVSLGRREGKLRRSARQDKTRRVRSDRHGSLAHDEVGELASDRSDECLVKLGRGRQQRSKAENALNGDETRGWQIHDLSLSTRLYAK